MNTAVSSGPAGARLQVENLAQSKIREVANAGMGLDDLIALWYGEPDAATPDFINDAAAKALAAGCTFYTENLGIEELREILAGYMSDLYGVKIAKNRIAVTASGMSAINLIQQVLTDPGDNMVTIGPMWPNLVETVRIMNGEPRLVPVRFGNDGWHLEVEKVFSRVDDRTRAIMINSPNNPTGWVIESGQQKEILDFARKRGLWIIADEVYARLAYGRPYAPSFLELAEPEDRVIVINSFSKTWCMTGWRLGWITAPPSLMDTLEKMIEYHYACPAHFSQIAGVQAVKQGEEFVAATVERYRQARDLASDHLQRMSKVQVHSPAGAFYSFFQVDGLTDSTALCKKIVTEARVGLAPGAAFGLEYDSFVRLCFASSLDRLDTAMQRLKPYFS